jgi:3-hydroxyacyl-CoA dehydrogenase
MDIVYINGYGFPIWRGGPMFYANQLGLSEVINKMNDFSELDAHFWKPAPLLRKLADESSTFGEAPAPEDRSELLSFKNANMGGV